MHLWALVASVAVVSTLYIACAEDVPQPSLVYDENDAPMLEKVLKMLDDTLSIDATSWTANLTTEELNHKTQLFHTDVTKLGELLNLTTTPDWIAWDQKYTKAIEYNDKVTNDVSNADRVDDIVSVVDDLNDVVKIGPGVYVNTSKSELETKLSLIVDVVHNISDLTGARENRESDPSDVQLREEIKSKLPDPGYSTKAYNLIKSIQTQLRAKLDFGVPDWSDEASVDQLREKVDSFDAGLSALNDLTPLAKRYDKWNPIAIHFNQLQPINTTKPEVVKQVEQAAGAFSGTLYLDVNDWMTAPLETFNKNLAVMERAVVDLDRALNRESGKEWLDDLAALHRELEATAHNPVTANLRSTHENEDLVMSRKKNMPDPPMVHPYANDDNQKLHLHIEVAHDR